jgi:hypothetical protein
LVTGKVSLRPTLFPPDQLYSLSSACRALHGGSANLAERQPAMYRPIAMAFPRQGEFLIKFRLLSQTKFQLCPCSRAFSFADLCLAVAVKQPHLHNNYLFVARINVNLQWTRIKLRDIKKRRRQSIENAKHNDRCDGRGPACPGPKGMCVSRPRFARI